MLNPAMYQKFLYYLHERETIRIKKEDERLPKPWTRDEILQRYKFTNVLRSNDKTTRWFVRNWALPHKDESLELQLYNCGFFRYFGTIDFAMEVGWQNSFYPDMVISTARKRISQGLKVFTSAYVITNQGISLPKEEVVMNIFMRALFDETPKLVKIARETRRWELVTKHLMTLKGFGGSGFMAKETLQDAMFTPVLKDCIDRNSFSPVGPGAQRGLNRLHLRPLDKNISLQQGLEEMTELLEMFDKDFKSFMPVPKVAFDLHCVQFGLCEIDKYIRVENNEGRPRNTYPGVK